jgi:hypothetical protein
MREILNYWQWRQMYAIIAHRTMSITSASTMGADAMGGKCSRVANCAGG